MSTVSIIIMNQPFGLELEKSGLISFWHELGRDIQHLKFRRDGMEPD